MPLLQSSAQGSLLVKRVDTIKQQKQPLSREQVRNIKMAENYWAA